MKVLECSQSVVITIRYNASRDANNGSYLHEVEGNLGEYLHNGDKDKVCGGLGYDRANQPRSLEHVLVTIDGPNDGRERRNFYPCIPK